MSTLLWIALCLFASGFIVLFFYVKNEDKKEEEQEAISGLIGTAAGLSFIVTLTFILFMLIPVGIMLIAKQFILFDTSMSSVVFIGAIILVYVLLFDHLLHVFIRKIVKQHPIHVLLFNGLRFFLFLGISSFALFTTKTMVLIALTITIVFFIIDLIEQLFSTKKQPHS